MIEERYVMSGLPLSTGGDEERSYKGNRERIVMTHEDGCL